MGCALRGGVYAGHKLDAASLAHHGAAIVAKLEDSHEYVRKAAVETLGKLDAASLVQQQ